ncbi:DUF2164 domain-containing protein [Agaribacterium sp. ZY112]|uniref:DUF2164 domain-containing protein n=1 Tax=Agaribacterium sp. ZY112 TaxID=3233574 RepID=UPI00352523FB
MTDVKFSKEETDRLVNKLKAYFDKEFDQEIGAFDAEFLLDFIAKELEPVFYNRGLADAHSLFSDKVDELGYLIQELEKPAL